MVMLSASLMFAQGAKNIKINEVLPSNTESLQDEFGQHLPWLELVNASYTTYNVRGMFITTNRAVLDKNLSAPKRISMMQPIPNGEPRTSISGRQHLLLFLNSNPAKGALHLSTKVESGKPMWIALYDGNGVDLIDSVSVPALADNKSFARIKDGFMQWDTKPAEAVTPGIGNYIEINETKIAKLKRDDPHGFGITVLSMGIVFFCLALLYVFFYLFGLFIMKNRKTRKSKYSEYPTIVIKKDEKPSISQDETAIAVATLALNEEMSTYMAVISMALKQYQDDVHDIEPGIITIKPHHTAWRNSFNNI